MRVRVDDLNSAQLHFYSEHAKSRKASNSISRNVLVLVTPKMWWWGTRGRRPATCWRTAATALKQTRSAPRLRAPGSGTRRNGSTYRTQWWSHLLRSSPAHPPTLSPPLNTTEFSVKLLRKTNTWLIKYVFYRQSNFHSTCYYYFQSWCKHRYEFQWLVYFAYLYLYLFPISSTLVLLGDNISCCGSYILTSYLDKIHGSIVVDKFHHEAFMDGE